MPSFYQWLMSQNKRYLYADAILHDFPLCNLTDWFSIHAPDTFFNVLFARLTPMTMASSNILWANW